MSVFDKQVSQIATADLQALLVPSPATENLRLEFKSEDVPSEEYLKKLSALANTYGGYLIVGAKEDGKGKLVALNGVTPINGFKERTVQWCWDGTSPPVQPFVSDPIPAPGDPTRVCYVIYVEESEEAPHFINGRRGCYVRADETSQRVQPKLATYEEIAHLINRRRRSVDRRTQLFQRSQLRLAMFARNQDRGGPNSNGNLGSVLTVAVVPRYPSAVLVAPQKLSAVLLDASLSPTEGGPFPDRASAGVISQHESILVLNPTTAFSLVELNTWGQSFLACEVEQKEKPRVEIGSLTGLILKFLFFSYRALKGMGYNGTLQIHVKVDRSEGRILWFADGKGAASTGHPLDDTIEFDVDVRSDALETDLMEVCLEVLRHLLFAFSVPDIEVVSADGAKKGVALDALNAGLKFNNWHLRRPF